MQTKNTLFLLYMMLMLPALPGCAQYINNGLSNATVIQSATQTDPFGISSVNSSTAGQVTFSRHTRAFQNSGIGGSFMGTTSVTAETKRPREATMVLPVYTPAIIQPGMWSGKPLFSENMSSPALSRISNQPKFPSIDNANDLEMVFENSSVGGRQLNMPSLLDTMTGRYNRMMNSFSSPSAAQQPALP